MHLRMSKPDNESIKFSFGQGTVLMGPLWTWILDEAFLSTPKYFFNHHSDNEPVKFYFNKQSSLLIASTTALTSDR